MTGRAALLAALLVVAGSTLAVAGVEPASAQPEETNDGATYTISTQSIDLHEGGTICAEKQAPNVNEVTVTDSTMHGIDLYVGNDENPKHVSTESADVDRIVLYTNGENELVDLLATTGACITLDQPQQTVLEVYYSGSDTIAMNQFEMVTTTSDAVPEPGGLALPDWILENSTLEEAPVENLTDTVNRTTATVDTVTDEVLGTTENVTDVGDTLNETTGNLTETVDLVDDPRGTVNDTTENVTGAVEDPQESVDDTVDTVDDTVDDGTGSVDDTTGAVGNTTGDATDTVEETTTEVRDAVEETRGTVEDTTGDVTGGDGREGTIEEATTEIPDAVDDTGETVENSTGDTEDAVQNTTGDATDTVGDTTGEATDTVEDVTTEVRDAVDDTGETTDNATDGDDAGDTVEDVTTEVGDTVEDTGETAEDTTGDTEDTVETVTTEVGDTVDDTSTEVSDTVEDTQDSVEDATGGTADDTSGDSQDTGDDTKGTSEDNGESTGGDTETSGDATEEPETATEAPQTTEEVVPPTAGIGLPSDVPLPGDSVSFDASNSEDPDGEIAKYEWDLDGDGSYDATGQSASHAFSEPGEHDVTLRVTDDDGATDETTETVRVNAPPSAEISVGGGDLLVGEPISLDGSGSSDPDGEIAKYEWDLDGDGSYEDSGATLSPSFSDVGEIEIGLRVTDSDGATDTATTTIDLTEGDGGVLGGDDSTDGEDGSTDDGGDGGDGDDTSIVGALHP